MTAIRTRSTDIPLGIFHQAPEAVRQAVAGVAGKAQTLSREDLTSAFKAASRGSAEKLALFAALRAVDHAGRSRSNGIHAPPQDFWGQFDLGGEGEAEVPQARGAVELAPAGSEADAKAQAYMDELNKLLVGQQAAKEKLINIQRSMETGYNPNVRVVGITGPSGTGKTEFVRSIAKIEHGDPTAFVLIEGSKITDKTKLNDIFGSAKGYVGSDEDTMFSKANFAAKFGDRPPLICIDEIDKVGEGLPVAERESLIRALLGYFNTTLEERTFTTSDPPPDNKLDFERAKIIITANAGMDSLGSRTGEDARRHFEDELKRLLPTHIKGRMGNSIVSCDPLSAGDVAEIAKIQLGNTTKMVSEVTRRRDKDITFRVDDEVFEFLGEVGFSPNFGARSLKFIVSDLLLPKLDTATALAGDDEVWTLKLREGFSGNQRKNLKDAFNRSNGQIPEKIGPADFPVEVVMTSRPARFQSYMGEVPADEGAPVIALGSGRIGNDGFILLDKNVKGSQNELYVVKQGLYEYQDEFVKLRLPEDLAEASHDLHAVELSDNELFFYGVHAPDEAEDGDNATALAYIYNHNTRRFSAVPTPPVALVGAQVVALDEDRVMITNGRSLYRETVVVDGEEELRWSVELDPELNTKTHVDQAIWIFDRNAVPAEWKQLSELSEAAPEAQKPQSPRVGVATIRRGDEIWFMGGEELVERSNKTRSAQPSHKVDIFNTKTLSWKAGPALPTAVAYSKAVDDGRDGIQLVGGAQRILVGTRSRLEPMKYGYRINPNAEAPSWKIAAQPIAPAAGLEAIAYANGHLVGPFFDNGTFEPTFEYLG